MPFLSRRSYFLSNARLEQRTCGLYSKIHNDALYCTARNYREFLFPEMREGPPPRRERDRGPGPMMGPGERATASCFFDGDPGVCKLQRNRMGVCEFSCCAALQDRAALAWARGRRWAVMGGPWGRGASWEGRHLRGASEGRRGGSGDREGLELELLEIRRLGSDSSLN